MYYCFPQVKIIASYVNNDYDDDVNISLYIVIVFGYRYLYSASHGVSQTEALSVHFSSREKVR